jgi:subtilisin-like proprotein convertase family protein
VAVTGAGPYLLDVDAITALAHSFSTDLDVTLTSPAGTVVTLTTDNGGGEDNVFDGTRWDDDANPGGQVPYASNGGLVTDHTYTNLVPVPTLAPEEPLAAFIGEDPNGLWTLRVSDDTAGDGGNLSGWSLVVTTLPTAPQSIGPAATAANATAVPTVDGSAVALAVPVSGAGAYLLDVDAITGLTHTFSADLDVTVTSPSGTVVTLTTDNGGGNDNVFDGTRWDDDANPGGQVPYASNDGLVTDHTYTNLMPVPTLAPEEPLGAFIGENPNGVWTLTVSDDLAGDTGSLNRFALQLRTAACDTSVTGTAVQGRKKQRLGNKGLKVKSIVSAAEEPVTVRVSGKVTVAGAGTSYGLAKVTKAIGKGQQVTVKQPLAGRKAKARAANTAIAAALAGGAKVRVTLTYVVVDSLGNVLRVSRKVKLTG